MVEVLSLKASPLNKSATQNCGELRMRRLDIEEQLNQKKAIGLSFLIHVGFVAAMAYAGLHQPEKLGSGFTEIEFVEPYKGKQLEKPIVGEDQQNSKAREKMQRASVKPKPKKVLTPPKKEVAAKPKATDVAKSDVKVAAKPKTPKPKAVKKQVSKIQKAKQDIANLPAALPDKEIDLNEDLEKELAELEKEKALKQKGPDKINAGNQRVSTRERVAAYGDSSAVRSADVLTPLNGNRSPSYPEDARMRRYQPTVEIEFDVDPNGRVSNIEFVNAARMGSINQTIYDAVRNWRFKPGKTGRFRKEFEFKLTGDAAVKPELLKRRKY
ncbi:MAG: hypothetical protein CL674_02350 [Bdellovibrionaceae bacterium]|mgnify:CR=1 FL=1|nr:hypothetical protein [Pseudobdellovibrionaceae bacterium]